MSSTEKICSVQFVRNLYLLRYPNRIRIEFQSLFNLTKINLLLLSKSLMFLGTKNRKVTLTKSKRTGTKNIEHNILETSVFFKAF